MPALVSSLVRVVVGCELPQRVVPPGIRPGCEELGTGGSGCRVGRVEQKRGVPVAADPRRCRG